MAGDKGENGSVVSDRKYRALAVGQQRRQRTTATKRLYHRKSCALYFKQARASG